LGKTLGKPTEIRSGNKSDPTDFSGIPYLIVKILLVLDENEPAYIEEMVKGCIGNAAGN